MDVMKRIPARIFECIAVGVGTKEPSREFINVTSAYYNAGNSDVRARDIVSSLRPDCVVFGEVMNEAILYFLAHERFAPIQILLMGAPVTSGMTTLDYFLSGDRLEHVSS